MVVFYEYKNTYGSISPVDHYLSCFQIWAIMQKNLQEENNPFFYKDLGTHMCRII